GTQQQGNRAAARDLRAHRAEPRPAHPREAGLLEPGADSRLGHSEAGVSRQMSNSADAVGMVDRQQSIRTAKDSVDMNDDKLWSAIDAQRVCTADLLETLSPEEWVHPSLCDRWTVRDVTAHLAMQPVGLGTGLLALRHPGGLNHMIREIARSRAAQP